MKKILLLFICICLTVCTITAPVSAQEDNAVPQRISGLLNAIGITTPEDNVNPDGVISRGQFAVYAARLAGNRYFAESARYYNDVPEGSYCFDAVSVLVNLGALSVPANKMFNPNNEITYKEVCKILMCVLNFAEYAEGMGGYPAGYEYVAKMTELDEGVDGYDMTFGNVMQILYNACHINLLETRGISGSYTQWAQGDETILSLNRDIYYVKGRVDKTNSVSLIDEIALDNDMVQIDGVDMFAGTSEIEKDLGHHVEAYYHKPESDKPGTMLYYYDDTDTSVIDIDDFTGYNLGVLTYEDEAANKEKTLKIDASVPVLLNGRPVKTNITNAFNDTKYGYIEVVKYNKKVSLVHIRRSETMIVRYTTESQKLAWDEYRTNKHLIFDQEKYDRFNMYEVKSGTPITYNHLQKGHILTIYKSIDGKVIEIYVSDASVTGVATQIKDDKILINGIFYKINKEMREYARIETGVNAKFYLDANGEVCRMEPIVDVNTFAYIYHAAVDDAPFSSGIKLKVYTIAGEHRVVDVKLPINVDGVRVNTPDEILNVLRSKVDSGDAKDDCRQLVGISFNSKGEVSRIDTAATSFDGAEKKGSLVRTVEFTGTGTQYYPASGTPGFYPAPVPYKGTKVIVVPETTMVSPSEEHFAIATPDFFNKVYSYKISSYKTDDTHRYADIIVVRSETVSTIYGTDMPTMIDEVYKKLDKNGDVVTVIKGVQWGVLFEAECANDIVFYNQEMAPYTETGISSIDDLEKGDLIRTATGPDGKVCTIQILHDFSPEAKPYWYGKGPDSTLKGESAAIYSTFTLTAGYVIDKWVDWDRKWDQVQRNMVLYDIGYDDTENIDRTIFNSGDLITIYDIEQNHVYSGSCDDIVAYNSGYGGTYMITASVNFSQRGIYAYVYPGGK